MADGDLMLDDNGDEILDDDGDEQLSDGAGDACCCGSKCFQIWTATWDCATLSWSGPTAGSRVCLPAGTSTSWTKTGGDDTGCSYRIYVAFSPEHSCTVDGDCSALGDTATPALPFGGGTPTDCTCPTAASCFDCATTPISWTVDFSVPASSNLCAGECAYGEQFDVAGLSGTFVLTQDPIDPCKWTWVGPGPSVKFFTGTDCTGDFEDCTELHIELTVTAGTASVLIQLHAYYHCSSGTIGDGPWFLNSVTYDDNNCCAARTMSNGVIGNDCGNAGNGGTADLTPHCA